MSVLDKFLNAMKLNDDDGFDDEDYLDEEEDFEEPRPRRRFLQTREDDDIFNDEDTAAASETKRTATTVKPKSTGDKSKVSKISPIRPRRAGNSGMEVCVIKPHSMEDSREITETLLANCTVVLNMEGLDLDIAQRIIDFASGSCYAIDGNLQKISNYIFIITPSSVDISGDFQEILTGAFDVPSIEKRF